MSGVLRLHDTRPSVQRAGGPYPVIPPSEPAEAVPVKANLAIHGASDTPPAQALGKRFLDDTLHYSKSEIAEYQKERSPEPRREPLRPLKFLQLSQGGR